MKKKMIRNTAIVCGSLIIIAVVLGFFLKNRNSKEKELREILYKQIYKHEEVDEKVFDEYFENKLPEIEDDKELSSEEYFFIAYDYYLNKDIENTRKYLKIAFDNTNSHTDDFIALYIPVLFNNTSSVNENDSEAIEMAKKFFNTVSVEEYDKYTNIYSSYINKLLLRQGASDIILKALKI